MDKIYTSKLDNNSHEIVYKKKCCCSMSCSTSASPNCIANENVKYDSCVYNQKVDITPLDFEKSSGRLLQTNITINNVCFGKKISIGIIIRNKNNKIIAFKAFTTMLQKNSEYYSNTCTCGTLTRKIFFVLPESDICNPLDLKISIIANYTFPCE